MQIADVRTNSQPVTYAPPIPAGGLQPISVACSPNSGTAFPIGATHVTCTGSDASTPARTAACNFNVTLVPFVPPVPVLSVTKFLAVGDSITAGENGDEPFVLDDPRYLQGGPCVTGDVASPAWLDYHNAYPSWLTTFLRQRYTSQTPVVINCGQRGEVTAQGYARLIGELPVWQPDVVLILEGVNDLPSGSSPRGGDIIGNLRSDIQLAKGAGAKVFLSTMTPIAHQGFRVDQTQRANVAPMNAQIRGLAAEQGVPLVDAEAAFLAQSDYETTLIDSDGLHCTPAGHRLIAQLFFDKIRATLESAPSSASSRAQIQVRPQPDRQPVGVHKG